MNRLWLHRMIWSYVPLYFIFFTFLFIVFVHTMEEQLRLSAKDSSAVFARQMLQSVDVTLKSVEYRIIRELLHNNRLADFMLEKGPADVYARYEIAMQLRELKKELAVIDSFYLLRFSDGLAFNGNVLARSSGETMAVGFAAATASGAEGSRWTDVRPFREYPFQQERMVTSLVYPVPDSRQPKGLLIVNVSAAALREQASGLFDGKGTFVRLYDRSGAPVFAQGDAEAVAEGRALAAISSDYTGWKLESGFHGRAPLRSTSGHSLLWMTLVIVIGALGAFSVVYVTRQHYKPIERLIGRIHVLDSQRFRAAGNTGRSGSDEFAFIASAIESLAARSTTSEKRVVEADIWRRKQLIRELLAGAAPPDKLAALTGTQGSCAAAFIVEIDRPRQTFGQYSARDQSLFRYIIGSVAGELAGQSGRELWEEWLSPTRLSAVLFGHCSDRGDRGDPEAGAIGEALVRWVSDNLGFTVTVGIGDTVRSLDQVALSYRQAEEALRYKAALGHGRTIRYRKEDAEGKAEPDTRSQAIRRIAEAYRSGGDEWIWELEQFFERMRSGRLDRETIGERTKALLTEIDLRTSGFCDPYYAQWAGEVLPEARRAAERFETIDDLRAELTAILKRYLERLERLRGLRGHHETMKEIRSCIEREYANPDLSLDYLSSRFPIGAKYLSQLFKEEFGENFHDFLTTVRIRHARVWLADETLSIQDVGEKVGYPNGATFRRVFRRVVGISPQDYRKKGFHPNGQTDKGGGGRT
ncbi:helix-turn-helix domain-containing protein [Paenibacillus cisolokensis]|uniref:helix-turn-helix domain-containing protein n=1 Tax=Paenibacillus cisolokensis TaxID=1658519 RepID=UPI003D271DF5